MAEVIVDLSQDENVEVHDFPTDSAKPVLKKRSKQEEKNKINKPGECMKYMSIEAHPSLLGAWYMGELSREAAAAHARLRAVPAICDPSLVMFVRQHEGAFQTPEQSTQAVYVMEASSVSELVTERSLAGHMKGVRDISGCIITLVVFGAKDYFKSNRKTTNSNRKPMTEIDLQMALTDLLVSADCDSVLMDSASELALFIVQFTKAIAEAPYKKSKRMYDELAEFYMRGDKKNAVPIDSEGNGCSRVWQQMVAALPQSSLEIARAVCGTYKSPELLRQALQSEGGLAELASLGVARSAAPNAQTRRLGPEFAKKLHLLLTAEDGDVVID